VKAKSAAARLLDAPRSRYTILTAYCVRVIAALPTRRAPLPLRSHETMGGGHDLPTTPATRKEMADASLAVAYRDACAHLLIPLNKCRRKTFYMPWECGHLRHEYERCQYVEWLKRSKDETVRANAAEGGGGHH
jgi:NADH dehydrogenase (ubiquinone) 1 beta subcomplex subunit 7